MHASRTAEHVALFRALETKRPDRLFADDYATRFLPARYRWLVRAAALQPVGHGIARLIDRRYPGGPRTSAIARTRLIDDLLAEAAPEQVLLLGAGYDSRAHRIPGIPTTYEVDHPATQRAKRRRIADRPHVHYLAVDLNERGLAEALATLPGKRTAVIWEGVTNYLTEAAVDATLRDLARVTVPGSTGHPHLRRQGRPVRRHGLAQGSREGRRAVDVRPPPRGRARLPRRARPGPRRRRVHPGRRRPLPPGRPGRRLLPRRLGGGPVMPKVSAEHLANRRRQILDAAANCFARNGFHRTSIQDIVKESGLSAGLIYRYFTGKDDMIVAIAEEWQSKRAARLVGDPLAGYLDLLRAIAAPESARERNLAMQTWAETVRDARIRELARQGVDDQRKAFRDTVPDAMIRVLVAVHQGLLLQSSWDDDLDADAFVDSVRALVRR